MKWGWELAMEREARRKYMLSRIFGPCLCVCHSKTTYTGDPHKEEPCCRAVAERAGRQWPPSSVAAWLDSPERLG